MAVVKKKVLKAKPKAENKRVVKAKKKPIAKVKKKANKKVIAKPIPQKKPSPKKGLTTKKAVKARPLLKKPVAKKPIPKNKPKNKPVAKLKVSKPAPKRASVAIIAKRPLRVPPPPKKPETKIAEVTHYYAQIGVAVIQLDQKPIHLGDMIHVRGHTTDFTQTIESMEVEHQSVLEVKSGALFGMKVTQHVRVGDIVYKL